MLSYIAFILCPKHAMVKLLKVILSSSVASCSHKISGITCCLFQENLIVSLWKVFFFVVLFNNLVSLDHLLKFRFSLAYIYTWIPHNPTCNFPIYSYEPFLSCYKNFEFLWNSHDYLFIFRGERRCGRVGREFLLPEGFTDVIYLSCNISCWLRGKFSEVFWALIKVGY